MARNQSALTMWSQYLAARLAVMALTIFDIEANLRSGETIGRLVYRFDARHRKRCLEHLGIAFPDLTWAQRSHLAQQSFEHLAKLVVEVCHFPRSIHAASWAKHLRLTNLTQVVELFISGRPAIILTGHVGNWEVMGYLLSVMRLRVHAVARPLDNPLISKWIYGLRERRGLRLITKWGASDQMLDVLDRGGILGFIADQNAGDKGLFVPFFGRLASTYKSIGLLALLRDIPIVCGYARRVEKRFCYELGTTDVIYPHEWKSQADPLYYVTARYMRAIERMIRDCPHQYLWIHRRWKSRPRYEREGKPMPASLQKNIESLPWMDQATLDQIMRNPVT